ncbi:hypothetical protein KFE25_004502 [Diacronema lutheri]|uniref:Bifunctional lysine-specific demethylase and histidyl-hydroxylase n=2 Tax=Diacronema lutheri TaxID=2081491 RepID=A0A8J6C4I9_DIALT|nr:hypothetical protein KFE25_004502 [Diacronema lutheri]
MEGPTARRALLAALAAAALVATPRPVAAARVPARAVRLGAPPAAPPARARRAPPAVACAARSDDVSSAPAPLGALGGARADAAYDRALAAASSSGLSIRPWAELWRALAADAGFVASFGRTAWKHDGHLAFAAGAFTMADLHARAAEYPAVFGAAAVKYNEAYLMRSFNPNVKASGRPGAWALDLPEGDDARIDPAAVADALSSSTVVLNSAGFFIAPLAAIALSMADAFELPVWLNMYLTRPGQLLSTQLHTDLQDVFVVQTQGRKRWRVYAPPDPSAAISSNPLARGKGLDALAESALDAPLIDTIMEPGQILYVPAGFPHTTSTAVPRADGARADGGAGGTSAAAAAAAATIAEPPSVHLTLGVDTHLWGLSYMRLREVALSRQRLSTLINGRQLPTSLDRAAYFALQHPLPVGMLAQRALANVRAADDADAADGGHRGGGAESAAGAQQRARAALANAIATQCASILLAVEPLRWAEHAADPTSLAVSLELPAAAARLLEHHARVMAACRALCQGGAAASGEPPLVRAQPLMGALDDAQQALADWADGRDESAPRAAAPSAGARADASAAVRATGGGEFAPAGGKGKVGKGKPSSAKGFGSR